MLTPESRIERSDHVLASPVDDELMMFDTEAGKYYGLNDIASEIWQRLEKPVTIEALCEQLTAEFDVEPEECRRELIDFLSALLEKGLIQKSD